jgi:hypothetical protein
MIDTAARTPSRALALTRRCAVEPPLCEGRIDRALADYCDRSPLRDDGTPEDNAGSAWKRRC